ncbi:hypothetical protein HYC85_022909 [Camellia sinensis]|uniref:Uncharacterized protein n=1 Tax=Camellia sinensis TaxID=4442 RepID=A0A7J7GD44_CAMSI|nr:hypothetical protein HYC85_022909 [Camellia sinensis]
MLYPPKVLRPPSPNASTIGQPNQRWSRNSSLSPPNPPVYPLAIYPRCETNPPPPQSVGLLYDEVSLQNVLDMITDWTPKERQMLRNKHGLERRGFKETGFLNEVAEVYRTGVTPAEKLLEMYHGKWGQSVGSCF